jgi:ATP-dependent HslUV protease ATP-binding subunit HslU
VHAKAEQNAEERLLDLLLPPPRSASRAPADELVWRSSPASVRTRGSSTREKFREQLRDGRSTIRSVEVDVRERAFPSFEVITGSSIEEIDINIKDMLPGSSRAVRASAAEGARGVRTISCRKRRGKLGRHGQRCPHGGRACRTERHHLRRRESTRSRARRRRPGRPDVSREACSATFLPIVEGTTSTSKYGMVRTDHILFIAAGAFHVSKPSDLIPELQGRFPIRVELEPLGREDFVRILTEPKKTRSSNSTSRSWRRRALRLRFLDEAIDRIADFATVVNERAEKHRRAAFAHGDGAAPRENSPSRDPNCATSS